MSFTEKLGIFCSHQKFENVIKIELTPILLKKIILKMLGEDDVRSFAILLSLFDVCHLLIGEREPIQINAWNTYP